MAWIEAKLENFLLRKVKREGVAWWGKKANFNMFLLRGCNLFVLCIHFPKHYVPINSVMIVKKSVFE